MPEDRRRDDPRPGDPAEGVRIIGAEEAAEAIERGDVAPRRGGNLPRYGDRPSRPPAGSPKPALRFPLDAGADPAESAGVRPAKGIRFDPRPAPSWDDPPAATSEAAADEPAEAGSDAWGEDTWTEGDDWGEPQEDVAAWTRGETGAVPVTEAEPAAAEAPAEAVGAGSWADDFADDKDPWDGTWDEPTGTVRWADDAEEAAAPTELEAEDEAWATFTDAADEGDEWAAAAAGGDAPAASGETEPAETLEGSAPDPNAGDAAADGASEATEVAETDETAETGDDTLSGQRPPLFDPDGGWAEDPGPVFDFGDEPSGQVSLPHWTEPATGELPRVLVDAEAGDAPSGSTPAAHWRDNDAGWDDELEDLTGMGEARLGALDPERPHDDELYSFDDDEEEALAPVGTVPERRVPPPRPTPTASGPTSGAGRNVGLAAAVGVGVAAAALVIFAIGSWATMALIIVVLALAIIEYQNAVRRAGYRPAALVGIVAAACIPLAVYWRGEEAYPLVAALTVGALLGWYLVGADPHARVVESIGVTLFGIGWVVGLGSFAALLLTQPDGLGLLIGAIIATVGYDVGGFAVGRSMGARPLSAASPNKTVEGLVGGMVCSMVALLIVGLFGLAPFDAGFALQVGILAALAAPLGDLSESLVKRDLGIKDMGSLLPEHGGVLDRFDALLFVLPAVYFGAVLFL